MVEESEYQIKAIESTEGLGAKGRQREDDLRKNRAFRTLREKLLTDKSQHKLQSTDNFIDAIKTIQIPDDYKLVSFDVKSLFTSITLQLALDCTKTCLLYTSPSPRDGLLSRMPSSA